MDEHETQKVRATLDLLGLAGDAEPLPEPLFCANALVDRLAEVLSRTVGATKECPFCLTPTYLRRHASGCGLARALEAAKLWHP